MNTSRKTANTSFRILGVEVDALTIEAAITQITSKAQDPTSTSSYVVKPYVEFLESCIAFPEQIQLLNNAEWCLSDGVALNWAAHYLYGGRHNPLRLILTILEIIVYPRAIRRQLPERFGGINFTWPLLEEAARQQLSVYLIGSPKHNPISRTAEVLTKSIPGLNIAGFYSGYLDKRLEAKLLAELSRLRPDIILVGMGFPKQELLMERLTSQLNHGICIGEGGTFDYRQFGGTAPKAPRFLQIIGLEWLFRLVLEPSRAKRQMAIPRFIWHVYQQGLEQNRRKNA